MSRVYLALGSNKGERLSYLQKAVNMIKEVKGIEVIECAPVYETEPFGIKEQDNFLNTVISVKTEYEPTELLKLIKDIEVKAGRNKTIKWGPREIDIDILFYNDLIYKDDFLTIPHNGIKERSFVLAPLNEIAADLIHPVEKRSIRELMQNVDLNEIINKYSPLDV